MIGEISEERLRDAAFDFDPDRPYFVGAEFYPMPAIGLLVGYKSFQSSGYDEDTVSIVASWFFRRNIVSISRSQAKRGTTTTPFPTSTRRIRIAWCCV